MWMFAKKVTSQSTNLYTLEIFLHFVCNIVYNQVEVLVIVLITLYMEFWDY